MKKIFTYMAALVASLSFVACTEDFNADVAKPQSYEQEAMINIPGFTATAVDGVNLQAVKDAGKDSVQILNLALNPATADLKLTGVTVALANEDGSKKADINTNVNGNVSASDLQEIVETFFGKKQIERTFKLTLSAVASKGGEALYFEPKDALFLKVVPLTPPAVAYYYLVGALQGWNSNPDGMVAAFYPIDMSAGTYEFTTDFEGDHNYKIWEASQFGDWSASLGTAIDGDASESGELIGSNAQAIKTPDAGYYTITINLTDMTYQQVKVDDVPSYSDKIQIIGGMNSWSGNFMTEVTPHNWEYDLQITSDTELKFRVGDKWDTNWGGVFGNGYGVGSLGGDNIKVPAGNYTVFFNDITGRFVFIEKAN